MNIFVEPSAKPKIGLVIQGPLISQGFNCSETIIKILEYYYDLFDHIIISTWHGPAGNIPLDLSRWERVTLLKTDDVEPHFDIYGNKFDNRYRQIISTYRGILHTQLSAVDYVIKIRTDQFVNLNLILDHVMQTDLKNKAYQHVGQNGFIYFCYGDPGYPYLVADFVFAGYRADLTNFLLAQLENQSMPFRKGMGTPENDFVLKHIWRNLKKEPPFQKFREYQFFPNCKKHHELKQQYPDEILDVWQECLRCSVAFLPKQVTLSIVWRGKDWSHLKSRENIDIKWYAEDWEIVHNDIRAWFAITPHEKLNIFQGKNDVLYHYLLEKPIEIRSGKPSWLGGFLRCYRWFLDRVIQAKV